MRQATIDLMIELAITELASGDAARIRGLVRRMVTRWPSEPALTVSFAISSAAAQLEETLKDQGDAVNRAFRLAALVAADVLAVESLRRRRALASDLLDFWRRVDPYFLNL